jgi:hypothetical protein
VPKEFEKEKFEVIENANKQPVDFMTIQELSKFLGAKI